VPWVRARLRGQLVYARAEASGALKVEGGRVEVRYKPNDGRRYDARPDNLAVADPTPLPDDTCGAAESVQRAAEAGASTGAAGAAPAGAAGARTSARGAGRPGAARASTASAASFAVPADAIIAYADGACSGNPGPAGLGVWIKDGDRSIELSEYLGEATNNIAELTAIRRVLEEVNDPDRAVIIRTDSQYSIGVLQKGWKAKANAELIAGLRKQLAECRRARLEYVRGHAGDAGNEKADSLAREAVQTRRTRRNVRPSPT